MSDATQVPGACLCGGVRFTLALPTLFCAHCHCSMCRRNHGAAYVTWVGVARERLALEAGAELLARYASSEHGTRSFCSRCGTSGVAVAKGSGTRTYMQMGTVGVSIGIGAKKYQVVFLFENAQTFTQFVEKGWQADATASAVAGTAGAEGQAGFSNGMASYVLTDKGLMAAADLSGTKYLKNKKLNK